MMQPPPQAGQPDSPAWFTMIPYALIFVMMYFVLIRPQSKARKEHEKLLSSLKAGDKVETNGGLLGTVTNIKDNIAMVRIADNVKVEILKGSITKVLREETPTIPVTPK